MEKIDRLLDALEHPEHYSPEEIENLLTDPETASLYRLLCIERAAGYAGDGLSEDEVDRQWNLFRKERVKKRLPDFLNFRSRKGIAAVVIIVTSFTLMGMGITFGLRMASHKNDAKPDLTPENPVEIAAAVSVPADSVAEKVPATLVFDNKSLYEILSTISPYYGVKLKFDSNSARDTYLYYRWEDSMTLDEVTEHLNTFSRINLSMSGDTLISK